MKIQSLLLSLALTIGTANAQVIELNQSSLDFGSLNVGDTDSLTFEIGYSDAYTSQPFAVNYSVSAYGNYLDSVFTVSHNTIGLDGTDGNQTETVTVYFTPRQNMIYKGAITISAETFGSYSIELTGEAHYNNTYYSSTFNKKEQALKNQLKTILGQGYTDLGYNGARDMMYGDLDNVNGDVTCVYTGRVATFNDRPGANSNSFNCEHTFPQGQFNSNSPMKSDIHHLFPTDVNANSQRGNLPFGVVNGNGSWSQGGSKKNGSTFEPRDQQKGATARAMLYFVIRYQDYNSFLSPQQGILKQWNLEYLPTAAEQTRNEKIYTDYQHNRNPFVDYPEMARRINNFSGNNSNEPDSVILFAPENYTHTLGTEDSVLTLSVVNNGSDSLILSDFSETDAAIGVDLTQDVAIGPYCSREIAFAKNGREIIELTFNTNDPNQSTQTLTYDFLILGIPTPVITGLAVYPNPFNDRVRIDYEDQVTWQIFSMEGKLIDSGSEKVIETSTYSTGVYIVNIRTESGDTGQYKIVK